MKRVTTVLLVGLLMALTALPADAANWRTAFQMLEDYNEGDFAPYTLTANTNTTDAGLTASHYTSGTPAAGIGVCVDFVQQTLAAGNTEIGGKICAVTTDVTGASEDFNIQIYTMAAGGAAALRATFNDTGLTLTGALDVAGGDITLENDETISNSVDGTIEYTATTHTLTGNVETSGTLDVQGGDITLENDEVWSNSTDGTVSTDGILQAPTLSVQDATEASGALQLLTSTASSGTLSGATDTIEVNIPIGAILVGVSLRVDVLVSDDGGNDTWSAEWNDGGSLQAIAAGAAAAKNTKIDAMHDDNANTPLCDAETDIVLTPNGGSFDAGEITAVAYYWALTSLDDAP